MANEVWERVYDRMAELAVLHRTTLIFVNTRRMAERLARHLGERLGAHLVAAHHGSLAKQYRLDAEQRLKSGQLQVLVATASLELGIDIGDVDLVCQVGSPRSIAAFLQRVGRAGHQVGGVPKGRLFPTSRDDLVECAALLDCVGRDELDILHVPPAPLDVLAQHIVAEVANREWSEDALFAMLRGAAPYAGLARAQYDAVLRMLADGYATRVGQRGSYLHRDAASASLRGRRGSQLAAITSGGTIPDNADYSVLLEPQGHAVGTVNEDFAVESLSGDVFQLGNTSYRILNIDAGKMRVEDARGAPPNIPLWLGEAPGRSDELSLGVARLRADVERALAGGDDNGDGDGAAAIDRAIGSLRQHLGLQTDAASQIVDYLARARATLGALPTQDTLVMERFFDQSGGMQLVLHAPFGSRINRAWGLALRKRFCRNFNVELQAAATEDAIILSLSTSHSFALDAVWRYLQSGSAEQVLIEALLDAPLLKVRWRWNATTALALPRFTGGRKVAPQLQRMKSDDLLAAVFPDQAACLENIVGERELPRHPLVDQTIDDCLHQAMDSEGWLALLRRIETGQVRLVTRDLPAPSPLALEILDARPYAFLDDAPLEERRTQAVMRRGWLDPASTDDLGALDSAAIEAVATEGWPQPASVDEMQEALVSLALITAAEAAANDGWRSMLAELADGGRATRLQAAGVDCWVALERLDCVGAVWPEAQTTPPLVIAPSQRGNDEQPWELDAALVEILRARLSGFGPQTLEAIATALALVPGTLAIALARLEGEGYVLRGRFTPGAAVEQWCERHLLARIHRYTIKRLRREIEPVEQADFMRFLFDWQHLAPATALEGEDALPLVLAQLEGWEAAAGAWESDVLALRLRDYSILWLDQLCRAGKLVWTRLGAPRSAAAGPVRSTPIVLLPRRRLALWHGLPPAAAKPEMSARAARVLATLQRDGALFLDELQMDAHMLPVELEQALGELVATGLVHADSFGGMRAMLQPAAARASHHKGNARRRGAGPTMEEAGRWALVRRADSEPSSDSTAAAASTGHQRLSPDTLEHVALTLLRRYGVLFWRLLEREAGWLPSWRQLLPVLHRLEARGEIRGGRFVAGFSGAQFALPEALPLLRAVRRRPLDGALVCVSGVDPLNLCGTLLSGAKVPAVAGNRVLFRDGVAVVTIVAGTIGWHIEPGAQRALLHARLLGRQPARVALQGAALAPCAHRPTVPPFVGGAQQRPGGLSVWRPSGLADYNCRSPRHRGRAPSRHVQA